MKLVIKLDYDLIKMDEADGYCLLSSCEPCLIYFQFLLTDEPGKTDPVVYLSVETLNLLQVLS